MPERAIDPESLARLLDGKMGEAERAKFLAELDESADGIELLADVAAVLGEVDQAPRVEPREATTKLAPPSTQRRWKRIATSPWIIAGLAAAIIGVAVLPRYFGAPASEDASRFARSLSITPALFAREIATRQWTETRGAGAADGLQDAARVGVYVTDIDVASRTKSRELPALINEVVPRLRALPGGSSAARAYEAAVANAAAVDTALVREAARAATAADPAGVSLGASLEAARLAIAARDSALFKNSEVVATLRASRAEPRLDESARQALDQFVAELMASPPDWQRLSRAGQQAWVAVTSK